MNKKLLWITRTAIFLALIVVVQFTTKGLPIFATGSLVNLILITCGLTAGLPSGLTVAGLSPVFALLLGVQSPLTAPLLPIIMVGNMVIVLTVWFFTKESQKYKPLQKSFTQIFGLIIGAGLKFYILYTLVSIVLPLLHFIMSPGIETRKCKI